MNPMNKFDTRLTKKHLRQGKISKEELQKQIKSLPEETDYDWTAIEDETEEVTSTETPTPASPQTTS